jgi:hypothetical protein
MFYKEVRLSKSERWIYLDLKKKKLKQADHPQGET